jgi:ABC-type lipoprotein export system ATPase subunit
LLGQVGLAARLGAYPRQLSAGQQQRAVIARALIQQPEVVFADEPTSDLDEQTEHEIMALFQDVHRRLGVTIVLVTHSSGLASYGTRALRMSTGQLVEQASTGMPEPLPPNL